MRFTEEELSRLRLEVGRRLSTNRFQHTLGVERMAAYIGGIIMPSDVSELRAAALLHDVSKEYSEAETFEILKRHNLSMSEEDLLSPALWHSITAPLVIAEEFSELATPSVLSAVRNHTTGSYDMSLFDEVIFLADYIEEGRHHRRCIEVREQLTLELSSAQNVQDREAALHRASLRAMDNTIAHLTEAGRLIHSATRRAREAIFKKTER